MKKKEATDRKTEAEGPTRPCDTARFLRTDLACEVPDPEALKHGTGASYREYRRGRLSVARLQIEDKAGEARFGREIGTYVTVTTGPILLLSPEEVETLTEILVTELRQMVEQLTGQPIGESLRVLVAGLGNAHLTADALGPEAVRTLPVTRHLRGIDDPALLNEGKRYACISAISPGVLADTGIETRELIRAAIEPVRPDLLIAVDALAARSCERLAATVQLSSTVIRPVSGVGTAREALNRESIGCPVIAIGVPTVVDSSTLVYDALTEAGVRESEIDERLLRVLENGKSFFVSPKEIDALTRAFAQLISGVIAEALSVKRALAT